MDFGNQGGFGDFLSASKDIGKSVGMFQTSTGTFTTAIYALIKVFKSDMFKKFTDGVISFGGILREFKDVFAFSKITDSISYLMGGVYRARKELIKGFSLAGDQLSVRTKKLISQTQSTSEFGIGIEDNYATFKALADRLRNFDRASDIVAVTSMISKGFELSEESAANITSGFARFGKKDGKEIQRIFEQIEGSALEMKISHDDVADNIAAMAGKMYRFNLSTKKGTDNFKNMALYATKIGISMESIIESLEEYRSIEGVMSASAKASRFGLMIGPNSLLAAARGGDMTAPMKQVLNYLSGFVDPKTGALSQIGIDVADNLGPMVGLQRDEIASILEIMKSDNVSIIDAQRSFSDRMKKQQMFMERIDNILYKMFDFVQPFGNVVFNILDAIMSHTKLLQTISWGVIGMWTLMKVRSGVKMAWGWATSGIDNMFADVGSPGGGYDEEDFMGGGRRGGRKTPRRPDGTFGTGMSPKRIKEYGNSMMKSAVPMLAFAGSMIMLAKAFKMFGEVNWKEAKYGGLVMGGLIASIGALGLIMMSPAGAALATGGFALSAILVAVGGSMILLAKSFQMMDGIDLSGVSDNLMSMSAGLASLGTVGLFSIGSLGALGALTSLGVIAKKYSQPLETLSLAIERLASSMNILSNVDAKKITSSVGELAKNSIERAKQYGEYYTKPIVVDVTLEIDGQKLLRKQLQASAR